MTLGACRLFCTHIRRGARALARMGLRVVCDEKLRAAIKESFHSEAEKERNQLNQP